MPRKQNRNNPTHVTTGSVLDDLGFTPREAAVLKVKAGILIAIQKEIRNKKYTQKRLTEILDEHQPVISNLLRGEISHMSIEKLLKYANRLNIGVTIRTVRNGARKAA